MYAFLENNFLTFSICFIIMINFSLILIFSFLTFSLYFSVLEFVKKLFFCYFTFYL